MPSETVRNLPPELGPNGVAVLEGLSFMFSNANGDIPLGSIGGLVRADTRFLNRWELMVNGSLLLPLGGGTVDHYSAAFFLTNPDLPGLAANTVAVRRQRFVGEDMHERIDVQTFGIRPLSVELRLCVCCDFADILEIKQIVRDRGQQITRSHAADGSRLEFAYRNGEFTAVAQVEVAPPATRIEGDDLVWDLNLEADEHWRCELTVPLRYGPPDVLPTHRNFGEVFGGGDDPASRWRATLPVLYSEFDVLRDVFETSARDLVSLRIRKHLLGQVIELPAAGLPWFLSIFGRDSLITGYQTVSFGPQLARGALVKLAVHQATDHDEFRDKEPGKMLHEIRTGELAQLGIKPYDPYYGTADATQLWLILLSEYWRWTNDGDLLRELRDNAYAALRWIDEYGDRDGDGYIDYATRSPEGLGNQCWRDSWDGVQFSDGSIPWLPIATCEIQGYTYDAKLRMAELFEGPLDDPALARRLRADAAALYDRFNRDFWIEDRGGYYAIGLDGDRRRIDSMTSNMGHLLWSGIVPPERAGTVAAQLMSNEMFSGWGVRTTSTADQGFNPIGYHMGTVWPHDNSLIVYGLARYGFRDEANRIIMGMLDAARSSEHRLPEAYAGYDRSFGRQPVPFPTACSPQAWASGAGLLFVRTLLGLDVKNGRVVLDPRIPPRIGRIMLAGTNAFGRTWDIEATTTQSYVRLAT